MHSNFFRSKLLSINDFARGYNINSKLIFLLKSQYWSREKQLAYQNNLLKKLIQHVYETVPYYKRIFEERNLSPKDIQSKKDLAKIPVINKQTILDNGDDFVSKKSKKKNQIIGRTGGTTGNPFKYISSKDNISTRWATVFRGWSWAGYNYGDRRTTLAGTSLIPNERVSLAQRIRNLAESHQPLPSVHIDDSILHSHYNKFLKFKPLFLRGFPSLLFEFSEYIQKNNLRSIKLKGIFSTAEALYDFQRESLERTFGCKVFNNFSNPESGSNAYECKSQNGMHLGEEWSITEILDENHEPLKDGQRGELVATNLHNFVQPFIRYSTEDIGTISSEACVCGCKLPLLKSFEGRISDNLKFSNGVTIPGPMIVHIFRLFDQVSNYQLIQSNNSSVDINIVKAHSFNDSHHIKLRSILEHHCGVGVNVKVNYVDNIKRTEGGKKRIIIVKKDGN